MEKDPQSTSSKPASLQQKLAAILYADVEGYSRLTGDDEAGTHRTLSSYLDAFTAAIVSHRGSVKHYAGDAVLAEFSTVSDAISCAVAVQREFKEKNQTVPDGKRVQFRVGINLGEVIVDRGEVYGNGVNVAARLETLAPPGGICISGAAHDAIGNKLPYGYEFLGEQKVKNIDKPVRAYRVVPEGAPVTEALRPRSSVSRKLALLGAAVFLAGALAWYLLPHEGRLGEQKSATSPIMASANRIAVLPFMNISADAKDEYFSDGMTEELITRLSKIKALEVIARTSVMQYKGKTRNIADIGRELNVNTILEGSVRKAGDKLRITAQLIEVKTQAHLWAEDYDRDLKDVFAIQSEVARKVADSLRLTLQPAETQEINKRGTDNLQAFDTYLQGLYQQNKLSPDGFEKSLEYFGRAIELDPQYARAYASLGLTHEILGGWGLRPEKESYAQAKRVAQKAVELDQNLAEGHAVLADLLTYEFDWAEAERHYQDALRINPNSALAHDGYGILYLTPMRRHDESIAHLRRAVEVDPHSLLWQQDLATVLRFAGRLDESIAQTKLVLAKEPSVPEGWSQLGWAYGDKRAFNEAIAAHKKWVEVSQESSLSLGGLAWSYGMAGKTAEARQILTKLDARVQKESVDPVAFAWIYMGLGDRSSAVEWLQRLYDKRPSVQLSFLKVAPGYAVLRSDPRFIDLLKKVGLEK